MNKDIDNRLTDLIIDYKCLGAYSSVEEMIVSMDCSSNAFIDVCNYMRLEDYTFKEAQSEVLERIRKSIVNIVVDELYGNI